MEEEMLATVVELERRLLSHGVNEMTNIYENAATLVYNLAWKRYGLLPADAADLARQTWRRFVASRASQSALLMAAG